MILSFVLDDALEPDERLIGPSRDTHVDAQAVPFGLDCPSLDRDAARWRHAVIVIRGTPVVEVADVGLVEQPDGRLVD
jgi:hypothetical protein